VQLRINFRVYEYLGLILLHFRFQLCFLLLQDGLHLSYRGFVEERLIQLEVVEGALELGESLLDGIDLVSVYLALSCELVKLSAPCLEFFLKMIFLLHVQRIRLAKLLNELLVLFSLEAQVVDLL